MSKDSDRAGIQVGTLLEMLEQAIDARARLEARQEWKDSDEYAMEIRAAVSKALGKLYVFLHPHDWTAQDDPRGLGFFIVAPPGVDEDSAERKVTLEQLLDSAKEVEDEFFEDYLNEMERLLRKYGRRA